MLTAQRMPALPSAGSDFLPSALQREPILDVGYVGHAIAIVAQRRQTARTEERRRRLRRGDAAGLKCRAGSRPDVETSRGFQPTRLRSPLNSISLGC
jgi:hypothetical protein